MDDLEVVFLIHRVHHYVEELKIGTVDESRVANLDVEVEVVLRCRGHDVVYLHRLQVITSVERACPNLRCGIGPGLAYVLVEIGNAVVVLDVVGIRTDYVHLIYGGIAVVAHGGLV